MPLSCAHASCPASVYTRLQPSDCWHPLQEGYVRESLGVAILPASQRPAAEEELAQVRALLRGVRGLGMWGKAIYFWITSLSCRNSVGVAFRGPA